MSSRKKTQEILKLQRAVESARQEHQEDRADLVASKNLLQKIMKDELSNRDGEIQQIRSDLESVSQELHENKKSMKEMCSQHEEELKQHATTKQLLSEKIQELESKQTASEKDFSSQKRQLVEKFKILVAKIETKKVEHEKNLQEEQAKKLSLEKELDGMAVQMKKAEELLESARQLHKDEIQTITSNGERSLKRSSEDQLAPRDSEIEKVRSQYKAVFDELSASKKSLEQLQVQRAKELKQHEAEKNDLTAKVRFLEVAKSTSAKDYEEQKRELVGFSESQQKEIRELKGLHKKEKQKLSGQQAVLKKEAEKGKKHLNLKAMKQSSARLLVVEKEKLEKSSMEEKPEKSVLRLVLFLLLLALFYFLFASRFQPADEGHATAFKMQAQKYQKEKMELEAKILRTERAYFELKSNLSESQEESVNYKKHADMLGSQVVRLNFEMESLKRSQVFDRFPPAVPTQDASGITPLNKGVAGGINQMMATKPIRHLGQLCQSIKDRTATIARNTARKAGNIVKPERARIRSEESAWLALL